MKEKYYSIELKEQYIEKKGAQKNEGHNDGGAK